MRFTRGSATVDVLPDGRVLVTLAPAALPFGVSVAATVVYPSLRAFLTVVRAAAIPPRFDGGALSKTNHVA